MKDLQILVESMLLVIDGQRFLNQQNVSFNAGKNHVEIVKLSIKSMIEYTI